MQIANLDDLLGAARQQDEPQRLLFVFANATLPPDSTPAQRAAFEAGQGGQLEPVMCVDKTADELARFSDLKAEAAQFGADWSLVFVAALPGQGGRAPSSAEAEPHLQRMVDALKSGAQFNAIAFDRDGDPVRLG
jgi:hypothetical protein